MHILQFIENNLWLLFMICYFYQAVYTMYMLFRGKGFKEQELKPAIEHSYGIIIAARNEERVIGALIDSIHEQDYPKELVRVYVVADNCCDRTAEVAREKNAIVFERNDLTKIGKGYALHFLFDKVLPDCECDAFIIFDADNLAAPDYLKEINKTFCTGYKAILGYRNTKNYASNWISAGYSLWFLRDSEYLNHPRMRMNTSCLVAGTGFLVSKDVLVEAGGWNFYSLTEDVEFSAYMIIKDEKIGYCGNAMFYDEQPVSFKQSWVQRIRWAKGFYQVVWRDGKDLLLGVFKKRNFACFDMLMSIFPALLLTFIYLVVFLIRLLVNVIRNPGLDTLGYGLLHLVPFFAFGYVVFYAAGLIPTITEWKHIDATAFQKVGYTFTFPLFMLSFIPIAGMALFKKVEWEPVKHTITKRAADLVARTKL